MGASLGGDGWGKLAKSRPGDPRCMMCGSRGHPLFRRKDGDPHYFYCTYCAADWDFPLASKSVPRVYAPRGRTPSAWPPNVEEE